jgi:hypothetical protein
MRKLFQHLEMMLNGILTRNRMVTLIVADYLGFITK